MHVLSDVLPRTSYFSLVISYLSALRPEAPFPLTSKLYVLSYLQGENGTNGAGNNP
jgi:hypothetical protein